MSSLSHWLIVALVCSVACLVGGACERPVRSGAADDVASSTPEDDRVAEDAVGETSRQWIVNRHPDWDPANAVAPDRQTSRSLADVPPGAIVDVYLGTWCSDSRRELPRFWRALELAGDVPFQVNYVGLDRSFRAGQVDLSAAEIEAVPTFVVTRDGEEVGRVVEKSPNGLERDLLDLLTGKASGKISATR